MGASRNASKNLPLALAVPSFFLGGGSVGLAPGAGRCPPLREPPEPHGPSWRAHDSSQPAAAGPQNTPVHYRGCHGVLSTAPTVSSPTKAGVAGGSLPPQTPVLLAGAALLFPGSQGVMRDSHTPPFTKIILRTARPRETREGLGSPKPDLATPQKLEEQGDPPGTGAPKQDTLICKRGYSRRTGGTPASPTLRPGLEGEGCAPSSAPPGQGGGRSGVPGAVEGITTAPNPRAREREPGPGPPPLPGAWWGT